MPHVTHLQPKDFGSDLDQIAREGARRMLAQALEAEVADYIARDQERGADGHALVVRNGKARARKLTIGSGTIDVRAPRVDDRRETEASAARSFRPTCAALRRSPRCSRSSTCAGSRQAISRRALPRCSGSAGSRQKGLLMAFQLLAMAERRWRRVNARGLVPLVRAGVLFSDGTQAEGRAAA